MNENEKQTSVFWRFTASAAAKTGMIVIFVLSLIFSMLFMFTAYYLVHIDGFSDSSGGANCIENLRQSIAQQYADYIFYSEKNGITQLDNRNYVCLLYDRNDILHRSEGWKDEYLDDAYRVMRHTSLSEVMLPLDGRSSKVVVHEFLDENPGYELSYYNTVWEGNDQDSVRVFYYDNSFSSYVYLFDHPQILDSGSLELGFARFAVWFHPAIVYLIVASVLGVLISLVFLTIMSGRRKSGKIAENPVDRIPYDLFLALIALAAMVLVIPVYIAACLTEPWFIDLSVLLPLTVFPVVFWCLLVVSLWMSTCTRIKTRRIFRNTLIFRLLRALWRFVRFVGSVLPGAMAEVVLMVVVLLMSSILLLLGSWLIAPLWILCALLILYYAWATRELDRGAKRIIAGERNQKIDTRRLYGSFEHRASQLNQIGEGLQKAVEQQLRSERMKTELITNVSHDIKTPLTSIINYVDLLEKEGAATEAGMEYLEVLDRQSRRLKKLIEDLIQASKAATGNLEVHLMPINIRMLVDQAVGEYSEQLEAKGLTLVQREFPESLTVSCDGQLFWRILDNLFSNICKYSQTGTRVYLDYSEDDGIFSLILRNISAVELNISSDELTERFVRGDSSRNTEGSGLGLSIAKSLAELQGGSLTLSVDGDLFKATVSFPKTSIV